MCGILGVILNTQNGGNYKDVEALENMLYIDALRGEDSTGIGMFTNESSLRLVKGAMDANAFIKSAEWTSVRADYIARGKAVIGHNRKKTVGDIKDETAHPFLIDNRYLFIHNGTLHSHKHLAQTEVDSEALGIHLTKCNGDAAALEKALGNVYGAYACAWIDKVKESLYLLRNKERPLYMGKTDFGWVFCSEPGFMQLACIRQGFKTTDISMVPEHTLITFDLSKGSIEPKLEVLVLKKATATTQNCYPMSRGGGVAQTDKEAATNVGVTKSAYKRFLKQGIIGKEIHFKIKDYIEKFPTDPNCEEWFFYSESPDIAFDHVVHHGGREIKKHDLDDFYCDVVYKGVITSMIYEPKQRLVNIYVKDAVIDWEQKIIPSGVMVH